LLVLFSPGSVETDVERDGKLNCHLTTSCLRNIHTKNYYNPIILLHVTIENVGDVFWGHSVVHSDLLCLFDGECLWLMPGRSQSGSRWKAVRLSVQFSGFGSSEEVDHYDDLLIQSFNSAELGLYPCRQLPMYRGAIHVTRHPITQLLNQWRIQDLDV